MTGVASSLAQIQSGKVHDVVVDVDIEHTYIGDLQVELVAPSWRVNTSVTVKEIVYVPGWKAMNSY